MRVATVKSSIAEHLSRNNCGCLPSLLAGFMLFFKPHVMFDYLN